MPASPQGWQGDKAHSSPYSATLNTMCCAFTTLLSLRAAIAMRAVTCSAGLYTSFSNRTHCAKPPRPIHVYALRGTRALRGWTMLKSGRSISQVCAYCQPYVLAGTVNFDRLAFGEMHTIGHFNLVEGRRNIGLPNTPLCTQSLVARYAMIGIVTDACLHPACTLRRLVFLRSTPGRGCAHSWQRLHDASVLGGLNIRLFGLATILESNITKTSCTVVIMVSLAYLTGENPTSSS